MSNDDETGLLIKYFVLKPAGNSWHAEASRMAMRMYAKCVEQRNPKLAQGVVAWVVREELASSSPAPSSTPDTVKST